MEAVACTLRSRLGTSVIEEAVHVCSWLKVGANIRKDYMTKHSVREGVRARDNLTMVHVLTRRIQQNAWGGGG